MSKRLKVFVSSSEYMQSGLNILKEKCEIVQSKFNGFSRNVDETRAEYLSLVKSADAIIWLTKIRLDKEILDAAGPQLKIVSAASAGVDQIDKGELKRRNVKLTNTPNVLNSAVANIAVGLMIGASRRFKEGFADIAKGEWQLGPQSLLGRDIEGSTVGIVGLGGIGQTIVRRLKAFDVERFLYTGRSEKSEGIELGASYVSLDALLRESDFVVLACPLTSETNKLINADALKKMKNTAILINISRGGVVDQEALIDALKSGEIWAAGLDVTVPEPLPKDNPLISLPNCFMIPHIGSATLKTRNEMAQLAARNVILGLEAKDLLTPVLL